jgi:DNA-binding beta-propeller fold protein YncE
MNLFAWFKSKTKVRFIICLTTVSIVMTGFAYAAAGGMKPANLLGTGGAGQAGGDALTATFNLPYGLVYDRAGTLYILDTFNNAIRMYDGHEVTTLINGAPYIDRQGFPQGYYLDGTIEEALFNRPSSGVFDTGGVFYVADSGNHVIRMIRQGEVYTFSGIGEGFANGARERARFNTPMAIAIDNSNNIYVADTLNHAIRIITPNGAVSTIAGMGEQNGYRDGRASQALFNAPAGIAVNADGSVIYVADTGNHLIRKIENGTVTTLAGEITETDEDGDPLGCPEGFNLPRGLTLTTDGLAVADSGNHRIVLVNMEGEIYTLAGDGEPGDGLNGTSLFNSPGGVLYRNEVLYVADTGNNKIKTLTPGLMYGEENEDD